jgi:MYXO-CTERM domain-containing protein
MSQHQSIQNTPQFLTLVALMGISATNPAVAGTSHSGTINTTVSSSGTTSFSWSVDSDVANEIRVFVSSAAIKIKGLTSNVKFACVATGGSSYSVKCFAKSASIGNGGTNFLNSLRIVSTAFSWFQGNTSGYVGFTYKDSGNETSYGWISVSSLLGSLATGHQLIGTTTITIVDWASIDDSSFIKAGVTTVPEPSGISTGLGALALGAAGLRRWRKSKAAKAA